MITGVAHALKGSGNEMADAFAHARRAKGPETCQPRATPWVVANKTIKALKGRPHFVAPLQGFVLFQTSNPGRRSCLALPWAGMARTVGAKKLTPSCVAPQTGVLRLIFTTPSP
jgi:hypothetical protein